MKNAQAASRKKQKKRTRQTMPTLRFTPYAWAKLLWLRDYGETEIGGFGISAEDDLLLIEDIKLVRQQCTSVTVAFDDESVADFFDQQVDVGRRPEQFGRVWIHTHPGDSADPSSTDERTFARCFGESDWSVMFIVAVGGETYARLQLKAGPTASLEIPVDVDFSSEFPAADREAWAEEYAECVKSLEPRWWEEDVLLLGSERFVAGDDDWFHFQEFVTEEEVCFE